ncbi:MAG: DNA-directed RNA polymerase subunit alpha [Campylobacterales bacterium]|jgi:DNA-directed RNA polymerase subunit alpha
MNKIKSQLQLPEQLEIKENTDTRLVLEFSPLEAGFGVTVAHPLRRTIIASSVGYAPVGIRIEGVRHEFDSIKGMLEDVANFIINLKGVRFKFREPEKKELIVSYSFEGPMTLEGRHLENELVEVVNPDEYIATLNDEAVLNFSILLKKGMGFVPVENFRDDLPEGFIGIDGYFSPVRNVQYQIENLLIEDDPSFEKVIFKVETDGQRRPYDLFKEALENYLNHFIVFGKEFGVGIGAQQEVELGPEFDILFETIDKMNLRSRSFNSLDRAGIRFIGELVLMGRERIMNIKNLGQKSFEEIVEKMKEIGFPVDKPFPIEIKNAIERKISELKEKLR